MATARPRTAGLDALRRQSFRHYYEPFTPKVEEREEEEAYILQLQLPDFNQQQVRVRVEKEARTVAVTGDRYVGNRSFRLDKTYPIPENCIIDKINQKLEDGVLTITMPKETTGPETTPVAPAEAATPPLKEPEQSTPEKAREETSPETAAPPPKEPEQSTPEKAREEISPEAAAPSETKTEIKGPGEALPKDDSNSVKPTAEIQQEANQAIKEEAPSPAPPAAKSPESVRSGEAETTPDQKISSPDQKATEKKEIENEAPEKGKESKTEEADKNQAEPKIGTRAPSQTRGVRPAKIAGGYKVGRLPLPVTASLAAAVVIAVAAYLAYAYYGLFVME